MPGPAVAAFAVAPGATMLAMKRLALQASAYCYSPEVATAVTSATIVAMVAKWIWKRVPDWIKEDISFQTMFYSSSSQTTTTDDKENKATKENGNRREDLTHLASVLQSFHRMTQTLEAAYQIPQLHAAMLAYIQWSRQMKALQLVSSQHDDDDDDDDKNLRIDETLTRDYGYETAGTPLSLQEQVQTPEHQQALEFATWAYHRDDSSTTPPTTPTPTPTAASSSSSSNPRTSNNDPEGKKSSNSSTLKRLLQKRDYELVLHHDQSTRPGHVAYYVAVSGIHRQVVIGVRGTSTLEDLVTDCCGHAAPFRHDDDDDERGRIEVEAEKPHEIRLSQRSSTIALLNEEMVALEELVIDGEEEESDHDEVEIVSGHERIRVEDDDSQGDNHIRCHEGILISAQRMTKRILPIIQDWAIDAGYRVVLCGHSLGAGASTLSALILRARFPELEDRLQVYAFAPPPVLDHDSAIAAAPFVTSFVHNADMIPRCSMFNFAIVLKGLKCIHERLKERGMNPTGPKTTARFIKQLFSAQFSSNSRDSRTTGSSSDGEGSSSDEEVVVETNKVEATEPIAASSEPTSPATSRARSAGSPRNSTTNKAAAATAAANNSPLLTLEEWRDAIEDGTPEIRKPEHLFVAGRVLLIYSPWKEEAAEEQQHQQKHPHHQQHDDDKKHEEEVDEEKEEEVVIPVSSRPLRCVETDGTSLALRTIEADSPRLFTDHVTSSYFEALGMHYHFE